MSSDIEAVGSIYGEIIQIDVTVDVLWNTICYTINDRTKQGDPKDTAPRNTPPVRMDDSGIYPFLPTLKCAISYEGWD